MRELGWRELTEFRELRNESPLERWLDLGAIIITPRRFTYCCSAASLLWLLVVVGGSMAVWPKVEDFGQYYMGGAMAHAGHYDSMYPVPIPDVRLNAGWGDAAVMPPAYAAMAEARGAVDPARPIDSSVLYINSPVLALLLMWMGPLSHDAAFWCWVVVMALCTWGTAVYAGRFYNVLVERDATYVAGVMIVLVAFSPLAMRTIRSTNITPVVAFTGAVFVWNLLRPATTGGSLRASIALVLGGLAKYTPGSLMLPALLMRRWGIVIWTSLISIALIAITYLIMGREPFEQFFFSIAPTLGYGSHYVGNQSLSGLIQRMNNGVPLSDAMMMAVRITGLAALAVTVWYMVRSRLQLNSPPVLFAACGAMTAWWAISGPLFWEHYYLAFCPFWPWLIWEARQGGWRTPAAVAAVAMTWLPIIMLLRHHIDLPEPLGSHMFFGATLMMIVAIARLRQAALADHRA